MTTDQLIERYQRAKSLRQKTDSLRAEAMKYAWAAQGDIYTPGSHRDINTVPDGQIFNSTATLASYRAAAGVFSYLMPVGDFWFTFTPKDPVLLQDEILMMDINRAVSILHDEIWRSNFQREMLATIRSIMVNGIGTISEQEDNDALCFKYHSVGDVCFEENSKGEIDTVFRNVWWTPRQVIQEFGDKTPEEIRKKGEKEPHAKIEFIHAVCPNSDYDKSKIGVRGKKFVGKYIYLEKKEEVAEDGFHELPYQTGRYASSPGDIYPHSPVIENLPDIRMLNSMSRAFIISSEKLGRPPVIVEDDSVIGQVDLSPDALIYKRQGAEDPKPMQTGINPQLNDLMIQRHEQKIKGALFNNLFQSLADYRNMTATEVIGRREEAMVMLSPTVSAISKELFDPLITRCLNIVMRSGRLGDTKRLEGLEYDIKYQGRLALAMSGTQADAVMAHLATWGPYFQLFPELSMSLKPTKIFKETGMSKGIKSEWMHTDEEIDAMMQEQAQANQMAAEIQMAEQGSKALKNVMDATSD